MSSRKFKPGDAVVFTHEAQNREDWPANSTEGTHTVVRYVNSGGDVELSSGQHWNQWWLEAVGTVVSA